MAMITPAGKGTLGRGIAAKMMAMDARQIAITTT
jgi:hypothetical protein